MCPKGKYGSEEGLSTSNCTGSCSAGYRSARFSSACSACQPGRFASAQAQETCDKCPDNMDSALNATGCVAAVGWVEGRDVGIEGNTTLHACPTGVSCASIGSRVERVTLLPGYWRSTNATLRVRQCKDNSGAKGSSESVCQGGASVDIFGTSVCREGNEGPYCAVCASEYKRQGGECVRCTDIGGGLSVGGLVGYALLLSGLVGGIAFSIFTCHKNYRAHRWRRVVARVNKQGETSSQDLADSLGSMAELLKQAEPQSSAESK